MTTSDLTDRQREIKDRLAAGKGAREIARELGISRNAVYQQIQRLRKYGVLAPGWTPTGLPAREATVQPGAQLLGSLQQAVATNGEGADMSGTLALAQELRRTRDELDAITRRISNIIPR